MTTNSDLGGTDEVSPYAILFTIFHETDLSLPYYVHCTYSFCILFLADNIFYRSCDIYCDLLPNLNFLSLFVSGISFFF